MKRVIFLLFCLSFVSLSYGQSIKMSVIVPTAPFLVVDELRVIGTADDPYTQGNESLSTIGQINLGVVAPSDTSLTPFQEQSLEVGGVASLKNISSSRDLIVEGGAIPVDDVRVNGDLFTTASSFNNVSANKFMAKTIAVSSDSASTSVNLNHELSAKNITINAAPMTISRELGNKLNLKPIAKKGNSETSENQNKRHIYYPWVSTTISASQCNSNGNLCTADECSICSTGTSSTICYDTRTETIPASYAKAGATFQKIGTAKFYCKPVEVYFGGNSGDDSYKLDNTNSGCYQYMTYFGKDKDDDNDVYQGFTTAISLDTGSTSNPSTLTATTNPFAGKTTSNAINSSDLGLACYNLCSSNATGCNTMKEFYMAVSNNNVENFANIFGSSNYCADSASSWPKGSGLSCKSTEKVVDVYMLRCPKGSGAKSGGNTITQYRKVACKQYTAVNNEYNDVLSATNSQGQANGDKFLNLSAYFYPEFED